MRSSLFSATLLLALSACGSSSDGGGAADDDPPVGADAAASANQLDVCQWVPKEVADLILGDARDPMLNSLSAQAGGCGWRNADSSALLVVTVLRNGTNAEFFAQSCAAAEPPFPVIDNRGIGLRACGRHDAGYNNVLIQLDATTTNLGLYSSVGTLDQAFEVLRAVATRIPPP